MSKDDEPTRAELLDSVQCQGCEEYTLYPCDEPRPAHCGHCGAALPPAPRFDPKAVVLCRWRTSSGMQLALLLESNGEVPEC